jgi:hypothetical protein
MHLADKGQNNQQAQDHVKKVVKLEIRSRALGWCTYTIPSLNPGSGCRQAPHPDCRATAWHSAEQGNELIPSPCALFLAVQS